MSIDLARRWRGFFGKLRRFEQDRVGATAVIFALVVTPLTVVTVGGIEFAEVLQTKEQLQGIIDAAALRGASEFRFDQSAATAERARSAADEIAAPQKNLWSITTTAQSDSSAGSVTIGQHATRASLFGSLLPPGGWTIDVSATATQNGKKPLCVLGIQSSASNVVEVHDTSVLTASGCWVQSNTDIVVDAGAAIKAASARAVGNATGPIVPAALTDSPSVPDPFANLAINVPLICNDNGYKVRSGTFTVAPGVHCGTIDVAGSATLVFGPGDHYFVNGAISVKGNSQITGSDVVLIFKSQLQIQFNGKAFMSLEGRHSGPFAGFVLVTDRSLTGTLGISTDSAHKLLGTIYLPNATLEVSGTGNKVADTSPWTIVVAKNLRVKESADLVINSNYAASQTPVPTGVGPGRTYLIK